VQKVYSCAIDTGWVPYDKGFKMRSHIGLRWHWKVRSALSRSILKSPLI